MKHACYHTFIVFLFDPLLISITEYIKIVFNVYSQFHQIKYGNHPQNIIKMMENQEKMLSNTDEYLNYYAYIKSIALMNRFNSIYLRQHTLLIMILCLYIIR